MEYVRALAIGGRLFPCRNVNLFRGGHLRDEWWRIVARRHGTFAAKTAFNVTAAVLDRFFTSGDPESRLERDPPLVDGSAIFLTLSKSMKRTEDGTGRYLTNIVESSRIRLSRRFDCSLQRLIA